MHNTEHSDRRAASWPSCPRTTWSASLVAGRTLRLQRRRRSLRDRQHLHAWPRPAVRRIPRRPRDRMPAPPGPLRRAHRRGDRSARRDRAGDVAGASRRWPYRAAARVESADATRHHQPARHRPLQVHDVAGDAASSPGYAGRVHLRVPQRPAFPLADLLAEVEPRARPPVRADLQRRRTAYLRALRFIRSDFVDFLRIFRFQREFIARARRRRRARSRSSPAARRST